MVDVAASFAPRLAPMGPFIPQAAPAPALSRALWVDAATTEPTPNGSVSAPYPTIQAAVDAALSGSTIYVVAGNYGAENVAIVGKVLSIVGLLPMQPDVFAAAVPGLVGPASVTSDVELWLATIPFITQITCAASVHLQDVSAQFVTLTTPFSTLNCSGSLRYENRVHNLLMPDCGVIAQHYAFGDGQTIDVGGLDLVDCFLGDCAVAGPNFSFPTFAGSFTGCEIGQSVLLTGPGAAKITMDAESYSHAKFNLVVFAGLIVRVVEGMLKHRLSVPVPAVAASGQLAYLDVAVAGTPLDGLDTPDVVVANPQADLSAAGVGRGAYLGCRVSAINTIRLAFHGILAGGAVDFEFCRVDPLRVL
jgi:hypothetical protein